MSILTNFFGTHNDRTLKKKIFPLVDRINQLESPLRELSDDELAGKTGTFRHRLDQGASVSDPAMICEVFAVCREASRRVLGQRHYDVQLAGGLVLNQGKIAEMKTGEGKTLTATLPCYLRGLTGKGAHVVTVNDYLARRDAQWMGQVYNFLGLDVGVVHHGMQHQDKKAAYGCNITYGTNNEFGFDYLRDHMKLDSGDLVLPSFYFAIVDEVDSILIDEARTPLIISGESTDNRELYTQASRSIVGLKKDVDYVVNEKSNSVTLTDDGITYLERRLKVEDLYHRDHVHWLHYLHQALKANVLFKKDVDYVVKDRRIMIIDEHTGRLMPGRRYGDGLHASLEAKENVPIQKETQTLASITFQNLFRMYPTLAGMTGTADTEAVEFKKIYNLDVVVVPTNKPIVRDDRDDVIFRTAKEKFEAIADRIVEAQHQGQPVLVGTTSVEKSELLSSLLDQRKIHHEILNAKNHSREAEIVAQAGHVGHVTLATNMAGRGTDIQLGPGGLEKGGLLVIGTERHESRRIDNQLRGRSGRQGDPGASCFYLSLEDDLMRIFAADRISGIMKTMGLDEGQAIESSMISRAIEKAQKRVEEQNFASRKHLLEYDDVMNTQRMIVYRLRHQALHGDLDVESVTEDVFSHHVDRFLDQCYDKAAYETQHPSSSLQAVQDSESVDDAVSKISETIRDDARLNELIHQNFGVHLKVLAREDLSMIDDESLATELIAELESLLGERMEYMSLHEPIKSLVQVFYLYTLDKLWKSHLADMDALKDSVSLRGYGQRDPLQEYKKEAFSLFHEFMNLLNVQLSQYVLSGLPEITQISVESEVREVQHQGHNLESSEEQHPKLVQLDEMRAKLKASSRHAGLVESSGQAPQVAVGDGLSPAPQASRTVVRDQKKIGRNDPCICGSGKKYKKCCGKNMS